MHFLVVSFWLKTFSGIVLSLTAMTDIVHGEYTQTNNIFHFAQ